MSTKHPVKTGDITEADARCILRKRGQDPDQIVHAYCEDGEPLWRVLLRELTFQINSSTMRTR